MNTPNDKITPVYEPGNGFAKKLDNFWYHHKWKVIVISFIVITLLVCTVQTCSRVESDIYIMYAGPYKFGQTDARNFESAFSAILPDRNGDGRTLAELVDMYILSDEQITGELEKMTAQGEAPVVNYQMFASNREAFDQQILAGDTVICLLDPHLYNSVFVLDDNGEKQSGFMPLAEVLGYTPEYAVDAYSVRIGDTPMGKYFTVLQGLDEDTRLCVRQLSSFSFLKGQQRTEKYHAYCLDVFRAIFDFVAPVSE
ncbi:MAG: hypothetical protein IIU58_05970 [Clostridia bacterium]|nr:hypothetical protein [Clostridia bacterium]